MHVRNWNILNMLVLPVSFPWNYLCCVCIVKCTWFQNQGLTQRFCLPFISLTWRLYCDMQNISCVHLNNGVWFCRFYAIDICFSLYFVIKVQHVDFTINWLQSFLKYGFIIHKGNDNNLCRNTHFKNSFKGTFQRRDIFKIVEKIEYRFRISNAMGTLITLCSKTLTKSIFCLLVAYSW